MRVVLVGPSARRRRLKELLPGDVDVMAEAATLAEARAIEVEVDAYILAALDRARDDGPVERMTGREVQVLELLADGLSNKAIAARLGVSDETVKFHLSSILGKLGVANRTEAVRRAIRMGLVAV
jgi:DNA-binding NarL/FixJ family response regulator